MREGYELVRKDEYPDFEAPVIESGKYTGVFGQGGLVLARIPEETIKERNAYFNQKTQDQINAVDSDMMRENSHSTMTISKPDRQTRVTFGGPKKWSSAILKGDKINGKHFNWWLWSSSNWFSG